MSRSTEQKRINYHMGCIAALVTKTIIQIQNKQATLAQPAAEKSFNIFTDFPTDAQNLSSVSNQWPNIDLGDAP